MLSLSVFLNNIKNFILKANLLNLYPIKNNHDRMLLELELLRMINPMKKIKALITRIGFILNFNRQAGAGLLFKVSSTSPQLSITGVT